MVTFAVTTPKATKYKQGWSKNTADLLAITICSNKVKPIGMTGNIVLEPCNIKEMPFEPRYEKTVFLHNMRKQRRRSAAR